MTGNDPEPSYGSVACRNQIATDSSIDRKAHSNDGLLSQLLNFTSDCRCATNNTRNLPLSDMI